MVAARVPAEKDHGSVNSAYRAQFREDVDPELDFELEKYPENFELKNTIANLVGTAVMVALHHAKKLGLITYTETLQTAANPLAPAAATDGQIAELLAKNLVPSVFNSGQEIAENEIIKDADDISILEHFMHAFYAKKDGYRVFTRTVQPAVNPGGLVYATEFQRHAAEAQANLLTSTVASIRSSDHRVRRLVKFQSMSAGEPGAQIDVHMLPG